MNKRLIFMALFMFLLSCEPGPIGKFKVGDLAQVKASKKIGVVADWTNNANMANDGILRNGRRYLVQFERDPQVNIQMAVGGVGIVGGKAINNGSDLFYRQYILEDLLIKVQE